MLIEFTVGNFRSFFPHMTLSMVASKLKEGSALDQDPLIKTRKWDLLRSAGVFGPNASGKSNLIRAISYMRFLTLQSATGLQVGESTSVKRFLLNPLGEEKPAFFQIIFLDEAGVQYRYGFELDEQRIHAEWLYRRRQREVMLFVRDGQTFDISSSFRKGSRDLENRTRGNALFLSVLAQFNHPLATHLLQWFRTKLGVISGIDDEGYMPYTLNRAEKDSLFREKIIELLSIADLGIQGMRIETFDLRDPNIPEDVREFFRHLAEQDGKKLDEITLKRAELLHPVFQDGKQVGERPIALEEESAGTQKFFAMLGPVIDTLEQGMVLAIDELDARLHPLLTRELIRLFNSPVTNPHNAQLIFATHDVSLLGEGLLRRDQVWFTEKDRHGQTILYSLAEMKERKDASYLKNYLLGRYGAIPYMSGFRTFFEQEFSHDKTEEAQRP